MRVTVKSVDRGRQITLSNADGSHSTVEGLNQTKKPDPPPKKNYFLFDYLLTETLALHGSQV